MGAVADTISSKRSSKITETRRQHHSGKKIIGFLRRRAYFPYVGPLSVWIILFVIAPLGIIIYYSFLRAGPSGNIIAVFTLENYRALFNPTVRVVFLRTFLLAFLTNLICLIVGYPIAYWIVMYGGRWKHRLVFLLIMPSWTCYLIRLYALKTLMGYSGLLNAVLLKLNLIQAPLQLLYTPGSILLGLVYAWLPFMVLPIYASLEGLDPLLLEASSDLGANSFERFFTVTLPLTKGSLFVGSLLVFIPSLGDWLAPLLLGGDKVLLAGSLVEHYFLKQGNIPVGSSLATFLTAVVLLALYVVIKFAGQDALERVL